MVIDLEHKMNFHEKQMNNPNIPQHYREMSERLYWYYLDLLTRPELEAAKWIGASP